VKHPAKHPAFPPVLSPAVPPEVLSHDIHAHMSRGNPVKHPAINLMIYLLENPAVSPAIYPVKHPAIYPLEIPAFHLTEQSIGFYIAYIIILFCVCITVCLSILREFGKMFP
jgi:hypothetical protein